MIDIECTTEDREGEPGPNFYWRGCPEDFLSLIVELHQLGVENGVTINLNTISFLNILGGLKVTLYSSEGGVQLVKKADDDIVVDLDCKLWRTVLVIFLSVSFFKSHNYIEFDEMDLREDANFIISSEK